MKYHLQKTAEIFVNKQNNLSSVKFSTCWSSKDNAEFKEIETKSTRNEAGNEKSQMADQNQS